MEKTNFLTEKEKAKAMRNARIKQDFDTLQKANPKVSKNRLCIHLASKYGITPNSIYKILL